VKETRVPSDAAREVTRLTNRHIRDFAAVDAERPGALWQFFCECGCFTLVEVTIAEYDGGGGVWAAGHERSPAPSTR
jgi:hypothetical protein